MRESTPPKGRRLAGGSSAQRMLAGLLLLAVAVVSAPGGLVVYEGFDYPAGSSLTTNNGGSGWSGGWVPNGTPVLGATNRSVSLNYTDALGHSLQTSGGSAFLSGFSTANTSATPYRELPGTNGLDGTTTWLSFLGYRTGPVTNAAPPYFQRVAGLQLREGNTERAALGRATASSEPPAILPKDTWALYFAGNGASTQPGSRSLSNAPATFVVARIDHLAGNDNVFIWLNPLLGVEPATNNASITTNGSLTHTRIQLFAGNNGTAAQGIFAQMILDEIRVGTAFADVAPTASVAAAPGVAVDLTNQVAELCGNAVFAVQAVGSPPLSYFWYANNISTGGNSNSLTLNQLAPTAAGSYFVVVSNWVGVTTSSVVALTLTDTTVPEIAACAMNQTSAADGACQAEVPAMAAQIVATDCSGVAAVTQNPPAGTVVGIGVTNVTFTVTDGANNAAQCVASLTVVAPGQPHILACAPNQQLNADFGQQAAIPDLTALIIVTNLCGSVTVTQSPPAGSVVGPGSHVVTITAVTVTASSNCAATVSVNARPVSSAQSVTTLVNSATNILLAGTDADGGGLTFLITTGPTNGSLGPLTSNLVTYTPAASFAGADAFAYVVHDGAATSAVAVVSVQVMGAEISYPPGFQGFKGGAAVWLEDYATLPYSGRGGSPSSFGPNVNLADQLARPTFLRSEPANAPLADARFFVTDLNRNLYLLDKHTRGFTTYLNFQAIFPKYYNAGGFAGGLNPIAFDPAYASNGLFYTAHLENPALAGSAFPVSSNTPGLNLAGYSLTPRVNPPAGTVTYESVLVEWHDTNIANQTFEGTAREILRVGLNNRIHPLGDLLFNPRAGPGDADYRNLYVAVGDGSAGETAGATRTMPQRLDALPGKILRITPDISLRPADELSANGQYRIPTTGVEANPFVNVNLPGLRKEIFAYGFRNCHRLSWDAESGWLLGNDIGLDSWEEINFVERGGNYGYSEREGPEQLFVGGANHRKTGSQIVPPVPFPAADSLIVTGLVASVTPRYPVAAYSHWEGDGISSGFVYRGNLVPELRGKYLFGDIANGRIFYCDLAAMEAAEDGDRNSMASIAELQIVADPPQDTPDAGGQRWRMFDLVALTYTNRGGLPGAQRLPGGAESTGAGKLDADGVAYGGGRVDLRLAQGGDGEAYVISKSDGMIRRMTTGLGPPRITGLTSAGGNWSLIWRAVPGWTYQVEATTNVAASAWEALPGEITAATTNATKLITPAQAAQFYRVRWLP